MSYYDKIPDEVIKASLAISARSEWLASEISSIIDAIFAGDQNKVAILYQEMLNNRQQEIRHLKNKIKEELISKINTLL